MSHKLPIWETMRRRPITLVSATYGPDGQLHQDIISGPKLAFPCLPEEGLYILYRNRGLQIASAACDRRRCYITQVCRCTEEQQQQHIHTNTNTRTQQHGRGCGYAALAWLHLYEAAETTRSLRLCFLAHPCTLSWDNVLGNVAFHFDSELEEHYASTCTYKCPAPFHSNGIKGGRGMKGKECPPGLVVGFIRDVWKEFLDHGGHNFRGVVTLSDDETEDGEDNDRSDDETDEDDDDDRWEWDDVDVPITVSVPVTAATASHILRRRRKTEHEFDLIDDVIEEEFPRVKKTLQLRLQLQKRQQQHESKEHKKTRTDTVLHSSSHHGISTNRILHRKGPPAPVIIPPKNMVIGCWPRRRAGGFRQQQY
ncbi:hypothetical protein HD806DRAFT_9962 [Xylariaceae sp. AK1471]|nr:hypothetical protein HD806DRAFT_9962 [Xylariaceae sp. AK1471]